MMFAKANSTNELLAQLIAFDTTSHLSNLSLIEFVEDYFARYGIPSRRVPSDDGTKTNLLATIGPDVEGGVILSGHTDVVPVTGQDWLSDPFTMDTRTEDGVTRHFGRGTADMKGFIAAVLAHAPALAAANLKTPIHIGLTYDEEVGCKGVGRMIDQLGAEVPRPAAAIVGEPTSMQIVTGHKGIRGFETVLTGVAAHSSAPHLGVNAIAFAARFIAFLTELANEIRNSANLDSPFEPPWTTFNIGTIAGGEALNIIADRCRVKWEFRPLPETDADEIVARVRAFIDGELHPAMQAEDSRARAELRTLEAVPPMRPDFDSPAERLVRHLTGANDTMTVAYTAEASQYQAHGIPAVLCGPGNIAQAHQPDEWIAQSELDACDAFLDRLLTWAASGNPVP